MHRVQTQCTKCGVLYYLDVMEGDMSLVITYVCNSCLGGSEGGESSEGSEGSHKRCDDHYGDVMV